MAEQRVRLDLAYDGSRFHGWARQPGLRTVQGEVEDVISTVFQRPVETTVAGRTDAGVHARGQVAHIDLTETEWERTSPESLRHRIQGLLQRGGGERDACDVMLTSLTPVSGDFDARFSAVQRHYCYRLADRVESCDPLRRTNVWWQPGRALDVEQMRRGAVLLVGERDFLSFCRPRPGATTIRTLLELEIARASDGVVELRPRADAFCHSMVRSLVGALVEVGRGRRDLAWLQRLATEPSRSHGVPIVPARGLTLEAVDYGPPSQWAARATQSRSVRTLGCC